MLVVADIFESPDRGETVYVRPSGQPQQTTIQRCLVRKTATAVMAQRRLQWSEILIAAGTDPELEHMIQQVELYYALRHGHR